MPRLDLSMSREEVRAFLEEPHVGVLTTLDRDGYPHSVGMYFLPEGERLKLWPYGKSQKVKNIERDRRCSVLVEAGEPYVDLRGVLLRGDATIERDAQVVYELGKALYERYFFPRTQIPFDQGPNERIEKQSQKRVCVVFDAKKVTSWNHGKNPSTTGGP